MPKSLVRALRATATVLIVAALILPVGPSSAMIPIEGIPKYQPQSKCSPAPKAGTLKLATYLQRRYPGTGSSGISRTCNASGVSEHKEGRAFDWRVSATSKRDRRYVKNFLGRILATDRAGNRKALARRMGIMYIIWNDHIWSASYGYKRRDYKHPACRTVKGCGTTLRHRDHVHISLTRAGGKGKTSWYQRGGTAAPAPTPPPRPAPKPTPPPAPKPAPKPVDKVLDLSRRAYARVNVTTDGSVTQTPFELRAGVTYTVTAAGLYSYGGPRQVGDAVCTWLPRGSTWSTRPAPVVRRTFGRLVLAANGKQLFSSTCRRSHVYRTRYTATATGPLQLSLLGGRPGGSGRLRFVVSRAGVDVSPLLPSYPTPSTEPQPVAATPGGRGMLTETVSVPGNGTGVSTVYGLEAGAQYRLTLGGVVELGGGARTDGQCVSVRGVWYRRGSIDLRAPDADHGNLYVNGVPFAGRPTTPGAGGCGTGYTAVHTADAAGRLRLDLWDPLSRTDNSGALTLRVQRLTAIATPTAGTRATPSNRGVWRSAREQIRLRPNQAAGVLSAMRLREGEVVRVVVRGTYTSHGLEADASCVRSGRRWVSGDPLNALDQDPLNLWVDGRAVTWRAAGSKDACSRDHSYIARFTSPKNGRLRLAVLDLDHRDNRGVLDVTLVRGG